MAIINLTKETFKQQISEVDKPVIVDFWAPWCTYCRRIAISFLRTLVFQIIMILLLPTLLGINGIWSAVGIAELMTLCVTITFFIKQRKKYLYV